MKFLTALCFAFPVACSQGTSTLSVALVTTVIDEARQPMEGVSVSTDTSFGITDSNGRFVTELDKQEGQIVRVAIECPKGWIPRGSNIREIPLRFVRSIDSAEPRYEPIKVGFECARTTRKVVLLVRTDGRSNLDVKALGRTIATTDPDGVVQTVVEGEPGDEFEVLIDTSKDPALRPAMPSRRLTIPTNNQILVFDQRFEEKVEKKRSKRKKREAMRPRRI